MKRGLPQTRVIKMCLKIIFTRTGKLSIICLDILVIIYNGKVEIDVSRFARVGLILCSRVDVFWDLLVI